MTRRAAKGQFVRRAGRPIQVIPIGIAPLELRSPGDFAIRGIVTVIDIMTPSRDFPTGLIAGTAPGGGRGAVERVPLILMSGIGIDRARQPIETVITVVRCRTAGVDDRQRFAIERVAIRRVAQRTGIHIT